MANFFPRWSNTLPLKLGAALLVLAVGASVATSYFFTPKYTRVGYKPDQPVPYDHKLHVGQLGMDCRYCHSFVEESGHANIPSSRTCWNCHSSIKRDSPALEPIRRANDESYENYDGKPVEWVRIHKAPDYVYFNHSVHVSRGVSCKECHGRVDEMRVVHHDQPHSMSWCLDCHRAPDRNLRPLDKVFDLDWTAEDMTPDDIATLKEDLAERHGPEKIEKLWAEHIQAAEAGKPMRAKELGALLKDAGGINPPLTCGACHR